MLVAGKEGRRKVRLNCRTLKVYCVRVGCKQYKGETQSEKTESGHGGWWGWGIARFWRRFDYRASNNLIIIPLTRLFKTVLKFPLSSVTAILKD